MKTSILALAAWLWLAQPAAAAQFTDLWFNPQESGWGASIVQQDDVAFVMLYVYGLDGAPRWYFASDARIVAYSPQGMPLFRGALHRAEGPWHGGPFDPAQVRTAAVGELYVEAIGADEVRLSYTAEGVSVTKNVQRLTWRVPEVSGFYTAAMHLRYRYALEGPPYAHWRFAGDMWLAVDGTEATLRLDEPQGRACLYRGGFSQAGRYARMAGTYSCGDGESGTFEVTQLEATAEGVAGRLEARSAGGVAMGWFSAVR